MKGDALASVLAGAAALAVCLPGIGWGLPSERRLELLLPDAATRPAILAALAEPEAAGDDRDQAGDPVAACAGPIDAAGTGGAETWLRSELVPFLMSSDDPDEMEAFSSLGKIFREPTRLDARAFLYGHVYLAAVAAAEGTGWALGVLPRLPDRAALLQDPMLLRRMYLLGRVVSVVAIALIASVTALVLRRAGCGATGTACGVLAGLAPLAIAAAHVAKPHAFAALFGFLGIVTAFVAAERMRPLAWIGHAVAIGIAASASPPYALLALAAPVAVLVVRPSAPAAAWRWCAIAWAGTGAATVLLLNPLALLHPDLFAGEARHHLAGSGWGYGSFSPAKLLGFLAALLGGDLSPIVLPLLLVGIGVSFFEPTPLRRGLGLVLATSLLVYGGFLGVTRIALVVVPLVATIGGIGADRLAKLPPGPARTAGRLAVAVLAVLLAGHAAASAQSYRRPDPGDAAGAWLNASLAPSACVTLRSDRPLATFMPRFAVGRQALRRVSLDAALPPALEPGGILVLSSVDPDRDRAAGWFAPGGPYRVVARFPGPDRFRLPDGPRRARSILILEEARPATTTGAAAGG